MVIDYIMPIFVNVVYCVSRQARLFYLGNLYITVDWYILQKIFVLLEGKSDKCCLICC